LQLIITAVVAMMSTSVLELRPRNNLSAGKQLLCNKYPAQKNKKPNQKKKKKVGGNFSLEIELQIFVIVFLKNQKEEVEEEEEEEFSGDGDFADDERKRRRRVQACHMSSAREACKSCPSVKRV
jgi:hypothetical protein